MSGCCEKVIYWDCIQYKALPLFVREQLIRLHRVTSQCLYQGSDGILPCNASFNTKWEVRTDVPVVLNTPSRRRVAGLQ